MLRKTLAAISAVFSLLFLSASSAQALTSADIPNFPACTSPSGTPIVSYSDGIHGIVGHSGEFIGSDAVYIVGDSNLTQCFCASNGQGIQTNWWKLSSLNSEQIQLLQADGWIYVPSGLAWGLDDTPYMALNSNYSCSSQNNTSGGGSSGGSGGSGSAPVCDSAKPAAPTLLSIFRNGTTATISWTKVDLADHYTIYYGLKPGNYSYSVPNTGNVTTFTIGGLDPNAEYYFAVRAVNNCMPSDESSSPQVLGVSTENVLGLASTGNLPQIVTLLTLGTLSFILFLLSRKYNHRAS